jgi:hypothetical protein
MPIQLLATVAAGLFAGSALYISVVEHGARVASGPELAVLQFRNSYRRGAPFMGTVVVSGAIAGTLAWFVNGDRLWLAGGVTLAAAVPYTLALILPISRRIEHESLDRDAAARLVSRWARLHIVRVTLGLSAFVTFVYALLQQSAL